MAYTREARPLAAPTSQDQDTPPEAHAWELTSRVLDLAKGLIVAKNPFLSAAVGLLVAESATLESPFATDGALLYADTTKVLGQFKQERQAPMHDLTHVLLHCLLLHPFASSSVDSAAWDLACDIVTESLVAQVAGPREGTRGAKIEAVLEQLEDDLGKGLTAERLYRALREGSYHNTREQWTPLFSVDSHALWASAQQKQPGQKRTGKDTPEQNGQQDAHGSNQPDGEGSAGTSEGATGPSTAQQQAHAASQAAQSAAHKELESKAADDAAAREGDGGSSDDGSSTTPHRQPTGTSAPPPLTSAERERAQQAWSRAAKSMRVDLQTLSRNRGAGLGELVRELEVGAHEHMDYRTFLRQFAVEHEDMRLSDDEFDYIFYTYGLDLYGNVPLVEPLEYRTDKRIRDFVIVIDTSSSVTAKVVQEFVDATFDVLSSEGGFFQTTNIHIIQADARVQSDAKISSVADLDRWRRNIKLYGFGGTDFRPAFQYVQQLRQAGEFDDLQGLIYFTDGWGIYPDRMPPYKCAFVFYDEDHRPELVPPWAIQLVLHPGEYESLSVY